ncbi:MAG: adenosylhomocysteinase, partial [Deltaproteobacteria bacterium]|nr:adenosylhomocysteinase [Deltaproteobacteria bacterium]
FNVELDIPALEKMAKTVRTVRPFVQEYKLRDGRMLHVLGEGRLINLAAAEGHPAIVMDMSFANQALSVEYMLANHGDLSNDVHGVPEHTDREIARLKLLASGVRIDRLTPEQKKYLSSWEMGT